MYFATVDEVEDLQHYEGVEDEGEVSGVDSSFGVGCLVVIVSTDGDLSSTADSSANHSIVPLPFRVCSVSCEIGGVSILRDDEFAPEHDYNNDDYL